MRYVTKMGDTLDTISERFGVDPNSVSSLNFIESDLIPGDIIEIPGVQGEGSMPMAMPGQNFQTGGLVEQPNPTSMNPQSQIGRPRPNKQPPILGGRMPNSGITSKVMGDIDMSKPNLGPASYGKEMNARKKLSKMGGSPGGMMRPEMGGQRTAGGPASTDAGNRMLDQLWNRLGPSQSYAVGGPVSGSGAPQASSRVQDIYNSTLQKLRSDAGGNVPPQSGVPSAGNGGGIGSLGKPDAYSDSVSAVKAGINAANMLSRTIPGIPGIVGGRR